MPNNRSQLDLQHYFDRRGIHHKVIDPLLSSETSREREPELGPSRVGTGRSTALSSIRPTIEEHDRAQEEEALEHAIQFHTGTRAQHLGVPTSAACLEPEPESSRGPLPSCTRVDDHTWLDADLSEHPSELSGIEFW